MEVVVDTNVGMVANGVMGDASTGCVITCARRLGELISSDRLVLDDSRRILGEYVSNLRSGGQPGVGTAFLRWVLTNLHNPERCRLVAITPRAEDERDFDEFPRDAALDHFDFSDRKFVAVSVATNGPIPILQAVDSAWWRLRDSLRANGVVVEFLCLADIRRFAARRTGRSSPHTSRRAKRARQNR